MRDRPHEHVGRTRGLVDVEKSCDVFIFNTPGHVVEKRGLGHRRHGLVDTLDHQVRAAPDRRGRKPELLRERQMGPVSLIDDERRAKLISLRPHGRDVFHAALVGRRGHDECIHALRLALTQKENLRLPEVRRMVDRHVAAPLDEHPPAPRHRRRDRGEKRPCRAVYRKKCLLRPVEPLREVHLLPEDPLRVVQVVKIRDFSDVRQGIGTQKSRVPLVPRHVEGVGVGSGIV